MRFLPLFLLLSMEGFSQNSVKTTGQDTLSEAGMLQVNTVDIAPKSKPATYNLNTKDYFQLLGMNISQSFSKPLHMRKADWARFGSFLVVGGAMSFADENIQQSAFKLKNQSPVVDKIGMTVSRFGGAYEIYAMAALGTYAVAFKDQKLKTTTLLASQAYINSSLLTTALKFVTARSRPTNSLFYESEPTFNGPLNHKQPVPDAKTQKNSFPSGHTTVAFAAATVFSQMYKETPIVGIIAYSGASLIGLSRVTENKHWATDVLAGAALGYLTGKLTVNNYIGYAKKKAGEKQHLSFSLGYSNRQLVPGLSYKF